MAISGLVVTLVDDVPRAARAEAAIQAAGVFTFGEPIGPRRPVVLETASVEESRRWHEWLSALDGVAQVDVAFVSLEEEGEDER